MIPETAAADRIATAIGEYLTPRWLSDDCLRAIASKVVAQRAFVSQVFAELDGDPRRLRERDVRLQRDPVARLDDPEFWGEHLQHLRREVADAEAIYARVCAHRDTFDPDARDIDREDDRRRQAAQDEAARREFPGLAS